MKPYLLWIVLALGTLSARSAETPAQAAEKLYRSGVAAEQAGDPNSAKAAYTQALRQNPSHANARFRLAQLRTTSPQIAAKGRELKVGQVMLPQVAFEDATLEEAIAALTTMLEKESKGEVNPNFVIQDPKDKLADKRITLRLKNIPARGALQHILAQAGARVTYDEFAIVITPL